MEVKVENSMKSCSKVGFEQYLSYCMSSCLLENIIKRHSYYLESILKGIMDTHFTSHNYGIYSYHYDDYSGCGHQFWFYLQVNDITYKELYNDIALDRMSMFIGKPDDLIIGKDGKYYVVWYLK